MRWEVRGKYYPTTPDQKSYEGAGYSFGKGWFYQRDDTALEFRYCFQNLRPEKKST
jgi:hypothetical protein